METCSMGGGVGCREPAPPGSSRLLLVLTAAAAGPRNRRGAAARAATFHRALLSPWFYTFHLTGRSRATAAPAIGVE